MALLCINLIGLIQFRSKNDLSFLLPWGSDKWYMTGLPLISINYHPIIILTPLYSFKLVLHLIFVCTSNLCKTTIYCVYNNCCAESFYIDIVPYILLFPSCSTHDHETHRIS